MGYIILGLVCAFIWAKVVDGIIENKGYEEDWFWWGFFFGPIAFIIALTKPDLNKIYMDSQFYDEYQFTSSADEIKKYKDLLDSGAITQEEFDAKKKQLLDL